MVHVGSIGKFYIGITLWTKSCSNHRKKRKVLKLKTSDVLWSITSFVELLPKNKKCHCYHEIWPKKWSRLENKVQFQNLYLLSLWRWKEQELRLSSDPISWMNGQNSRVVVHHFNWDHIPNPFWPFHKLQFCFIQLLNS